MIITITNNSEDKTLILSAPTSDIFVSISDWSNHALQPGESASATAALPSTGYIGGGLQFTHNLHPSEFSVSAEFSYYELVVNGTIQNLRLNETSGTNANDTSAENNDGTYSAGVVLAAAESPASGDDMPLFDGDDSVNIINVAGDFDPTLGSIVFFIQAANAAVWSDASYMQLARIFVDGNNRIDIFKNTSPADQVVYRYYANGTINEGLADIPHTTANFHIGFTWNKAQDRVTAYLNGIEIDSASGLDTWTGTPILCVVGLESIGGSLGWEGYISQFRVYDRELTSDEMATLSLQ